MAEIYQSGGKWYVKQGGSILEIGSVASVATGSNGISTVAGTTAYVYATGACTETGGVTIGNNKTIDGFDRVGTTWTLFAAANTIGNYVVIKNMTIALSYAAAGCLTVGTNVEFHNVVFNITVTGATAGYSFITLGNSDKFYNCTFNFLGTVPAVFFRLVYTTAINDVFEDCTIVIQHGAGNKEKQTFLYTQGGGKHYLKNIYVEASTPAITAASDWRIFQFRSSSSVIVEAISCSTTIGRTSGIYPGLVDFETCTYATVKDIKKLDVAFSSSSHYAMIDGLSEMSYFTMNTMDYCNVGYVYATTVILNTVTHTEIESLKGTTLTDPASSYLTIGILDFATFSSVSSSYLLIQDWYNLNGTATIAGAGVTIERFHIVNASTLDVTASGFTINEILLGANLTLQFTGGAIYGVLIGNVTRTASAPTPYLNMASIPTTVTDFRLNGCYNIGAAGGTITLSGVKLYFKNCTFSSNTTCPGSEIHFDNCAFSGTFNLAGTKCTGREITFASTVAFANGGGSDDATYGHWEKLVLTGANALTVASDCVYNVFNGIRYSGTGATITVTGDNNSFSDVHNADGFVFDTNANNCSLKDSVLVKTLTLSTGAERTVINNVYFTDAANTHITVTAGTADIKNISANTTIHDFTITGSSNRVEHVGAVNLTVSGGSNEINDLCDAGNNVTFAATTTGATIRHALITTFTDNAANASWTMFDCTVTNAASLAADHFLIEHSTFASDLTVANTTGGRLRSCFLSDSLLLNMSAGLVVDDTYIADSIHFTHGAATDGVLITNCRITVDIELDAAINIMIMNTRVWGSIYTWVDGSATPVTDITIMGCRAATYVFQVADTGYITDCGYVTTFTDSGLTFPAGTSYTITAV